MKDIELIDKFFRYLYDNGSIKYYEKVMRECGFNENLINEREILKFQRLLVSSGFVNETNIRVGDGPFAVKINDAGSKMIIEYGSYEKYLDSIKREKILERKLKEAKLKEIKVAIFTAVLAIIATLFLSEPIKIVWKIFLQWIQGN